MIKTIFFDIDGTITEDLSGNCEVGYFEYALRDLIIRKYRLSPHESMKKVLEAEQKILGKDPFLALPYLDLAISNKELWQEVLKLQSKTLKVYPESVCFIKTLYKIKYNLYVVTNNTINRALSKLARAGLATQKGTKYFKKIYGYDFAECQKDSPNFYRKVLSDGKFNIENIVMVGDNTNDDMEIPKKVGIENFIIINRKQKEKIIKKENAYFVSNLKFLLENLKNENEIGCI